MSGRTRPDPARPCRGGAPVGFLDALPTADVAAVLYFRMWCAGRAGQAQVREDFRLLLGPVDSVEALGTLDDLLRTLHAHGRRPLVRHHETCRCVGADEAAFATLLGAAATGEREDAVLIATLLVRADTAFRVADLAARLGRDLRRLTRRLPEAGKAEMGGASAEVPATVH